MKIKFYAHASFRLEGKDKTVVTDPYEPPVAQFDPIDEPADLVLKSWTRTASTTTPATCRATPWWSTP